MFNLGICLKIALAKKNLSQKSFAEMMGVKQQVVSRWVTTGGISNKNVDLICKCLELSFSEFIALGE